MDTIMRTLLIALLCLTPVAPAIGLGQAEQHRERMYEQYREGDLETAIALGREVLELQPEDARTMYALSFFFSLQGNIDSSLFWLENTVRSGYADYLHFELDSDLDAIRSHPRYSEILDLARREALKQNREKALIVTEGQWTPVPLESIHELPHLEAALSFDHHGLKIRATVHDSHFRDGNRAWRYGDGFMINFVVPAEGDSVFSDRFHAYGFALESGKPIAVLVNKDGKYFLWKRDEIPPQIEIDSNSTTATYLITIPWEYLYPFHPLLNDRAGINILYTSQSDDRSRKRVTYLENGHFDSESTTLRRFAPLTFVYSEESPLALTGELKTRLVSGNTLDVSFAAWSPTENEIRAPLSINNEAGEEVWSGACLELVPPGRSTRWKPVNLSDNMGMYTFVADFQDSDQWEETFYRYDPGDLERVLRLLDTPGSDTEPLVQTNSRVGMQYRLHLLEDRIKGFTPRSSLRAVKDDFEDLESLMQLYESQQTIYAREGYLLSAFRSQIDSSLQPFSIILPQGFDPNRTYNLYVGLHGSGVDEVGFVRWSARDEHDDHITLAPRGRDLSGWWRGDDQRDAAHLIRLVKEMFRIDRTLCYGFSMGGYGVWRMSFLHPDLFDGAICVSGTPRFRSPDPEDDMGNHIGKGKELTYLVIHGTEDHAVDIKQTDEFVGRLKEAGYDIRYVRVPGGGHGNFNFEPIVEEWLTEKAFEEPK